MTYQTGNQDKTYKKASRLLNLTLALCMALSLCACKIPDSTVSANFTFDKSVYELEVGETLMYSFENNGIAGFDESEVEVVSSDTSVLEIENGKMTGIEVGTATVTATFNEYKATASVTVTEAGSEDSTGEEDSSSEDETTETPSDGVDWGADIWGDEYSAATADQLAAFSQDVFFVQGRAYTENGALVFDNVNSGLEYFICGTESSVTLSVPSSYAGNDLYIGVYVDDGEGTYVQLDTYGDAVEYKIASGLERGIHKIGIYKATEQHLWTAGDRKLVVKNVVNSADGYVLANIPNEKDIKIDFYGDSITCGLNNLGDDSAFPTGKEDGTKSYAAIAGRTLNAEVSMVSYSGITTDCTFNTGENVMTSIWDKYSAISGTAYTLDTNTDFAVINLGTNDASALKAEKTTENELLSAAKSLLTAMRNKYGEKTKIVWCYGMMGVDNRVEGAFKTAVSELGGEDSGFYYFTFSTKSSGGVHPLVSQHEAAATELCNFIKSLQQAS